MEDGMVNFMNKIYLPNCSELKNLILKEFHVNSYLGHLGYDKILKIVKKLYHGPNLKK